MAVAWAIPTELFNSLGVVKFVKKEIIIDLGPPQCSLSDNDLNFERKGVQDFAYRYNIQWKGTATYNSQGWNPEEIIAKCDKQCALNIFVACCQEDNYHHFTSQRLYQGP